MEPLPAASRGGIGTGHRLVAWCVWLADDADPGRMSAIFVAADMVVFHQRPAAGCKMDLGGGTESSGNRPAGRGRGIGASAAGFILAADFSPRNCGDDLDEFPAQ